MVKSKFKMIGHELRTLEVKGYHSTNSADTSDQANARFLRKMIPFKHSCFCLHPIRGSLSNAELGIVCLNAAKLKVRHLMPLFRTLFPKRFHTRIAQKKSFFNSASPDVNTM